MNAISILGYIIPDSQVKSGKVVLNNSMLGNDLAADEAIFEVHYTGSMPYEDYLYSNENDQLFSNEGDALLGWESQSATIDLNNIPYGTPIVYSHDGNVIGKFYTKQIIQTETNFWQITSQSAMGILITQEHNGGVYSADSGDTIKSVIDEIMNGLNIPYTVSNAIKDQAVAGWLPVASCRDNLQQLCFAFGISVLKDSDGDLLFDFNEPDTPEATLIASKVYLDGRDRALIAPATKVTVYEHAYYPITTMTPITVFDNTTDVSATNQKIIFDNPVIVSTLTTTGTITISESGANYAIVSGVGTVTAVEYTHTIKVLTQNTSVTTAENKELTVKDATLVNALNSANCLNRVAAYYTEANEVTLGFVMEAERAGELVAYPKPFSSELVAGLIKQMNITVSGILKSATKLTEDWLPRYLGNNFSDYELITSGASWTPDFTGNVRVFLCGGGKGGYGGFNGGGASGNTPGTGGLGGQGGEAGKIFVFNISVVSGTTYSLTLGTGGSGGATNNGEGSLGTATSITISGTTYSSSNGAVPSNGLVNPITGDIYALQGEQGTQGANGGMYGWTSSNSYVYDDVWYYINAGQNGGDVTYDGVTYTGGVGGTASNYEGYAKTGGGGGGAAVGNNGNNGGNTKGGNGANASLVASDNVTTLGGGGHGGHGAGGGGCGGLDSTGFPGTDGVGGQGSLGADGGNGFILILK